MPTLYIIGDSVDVTGTVTPAASGTWTGEVWGSGQAGNAGTGDSGAGAGWAKKNVISATSGTPISFFLGRAYADDGLVGGDTWLVAAGTLIANGGASATTRIGDATAAGGAGQPFAAAGMPGGGGAGGPGGSGHSGGASDSWNGGGGGGAGGGSDGGSTAFTDTPEKGGDGGNGPRGVGGLGGTSGVQPFGLTGGVGAGGGGGWGDGVSLHGSGGAGGDDWDFGGGGGGGPGVGTVSGGTDVDGAGAPGGTPGGGGTSCQGDGPYTPDTGRGRGGFSLVKIVYTGPNPTVSLVGGGTYRIVQPEAAPEPVRRTGRFRRRRPGRGPIPLVPDARKDFSPPSGVVQLMASSRVGLAGRAAPVARPPLGARSKVTARGRGALGTQTPTAMTILTPFLVNTTLFEEGQQDESVGVNDVRTLVDTLASLPPSASSPQNSHYTAQFADYGCVVEFNGSGAQNFIIPAFADVPLAIGATLWGYQGGTGSVTFTAAAGVTLRAVVTPVTSGQYAMVGARKRGTDEWVTIWPATAAATTTSTTTTTTTTPAPTTTLPPGLLTSASSPQTADYTAVLADAGTIVEFTGASAQNLVIPTNASVPYPLGTVLRGAQMGTGFVTFTTAGGVTLRCFSPQGPTTAGQYCMIEARKRATDEWVFLMNVTTVFG